MTTKLLPQSEREALENFLDAQRIGLIRKVEGVSDEAGRRAPTASSLSLIGLVKHAATWEQRWFQLAVAGQPSPDGWPEVLPSRATRHAGHADIIRETLDGARGL
ncbi:mycothiol transferase [Kribbella endophytica]